MTSRIINSIETLLQSATVWMVTGSIVLMAAQAIGYMFYGMSAFFVVAAIWCAITCALMMIYIAVLVIRHRSINAAPKLYLAIVLTVAPVITTGGNWQWFIPNLTLAALLCAVAAGQRKVAPQTIRFKQNAQNQQAHAKDHAHHKAVYKFPAEWPKVTFRDVIGMQEVKNRMLEAGREIIAIQTQGHNEDAAPRNGILLFGEPGNGKTMFAEALAGELRLPFVSVAFGDVASSWVNQTTEHVMRAFKDARAQAPCVLFIDEIDSLIKDRNTTMASGNEESAKITNTILTELVKARESGLVMIAATNFLNKLDQAAIREGRFDFKIEIPSPDAPARAAIIRNVAAKHPAITVSAEALRLAAGRWSGFSAARLRAVTTEATRAAKKDGRITIEFSHLQQALRTTQGRRGELPENTPEVHELVMIPSQKQRLTGIVARMREIERIEELGGTVPSGILFWGPPGTGKTLTARALAKSTGWAFLATSGNELLARPDYIDDLAREARDIRPCIVFLDEADDVLADRRYAAHGASVTNRLLTAVDGAGGKTHDVLWIAATNHPDALDAAAMRGGRFSEKIEFSLPDHAVTTGYVRDWIRNSKAKFSPAVTPSAAAELLAGLSIANVAAILQRSADIMVERCVTTGRDEKVTMNDLVHARSSVLGLH